MVSGRLRTDVLVVGAGPVGALLGCELARFDARFAIVDRARTTAPYSRASDVKAATLEALDLSGLAEEVVGAGTRIEKFVLRSGARPILECDFTLTRSRFRFLLGLEQSRLEQILTGRLASLGIPVRRGTELVGLTSRDDGVRATLRDESGVETIVDADWLVACDGAHSSVRGLLGSPFLGSTYRDTLLVADAEVRWSLPSGQIQCFVHSGGFFYFQPLPGERRYRILGMDRAASAPILDGAAFRRLVGRAARVPLAIEPETPVARVRIHRRALRTTRSGRVVFVGDAARVFSPVGGFGLNVGLEDACSLGWRLARVSRGQASSVLLDDYARERGRVARAVLRDTHGLTGVLSPRGGTYFVRRALLSAFGCAALIRHVERTAANRQNGLGFEERGRTSAWLQRWRRPRGGRGDTIARRIPDGIVSTSDGPCWLSELRRWAGFSLLVFPNDRSAQPFDPWRVMPELSVLRAAGIELRIVVVRGHGDPEVVFAGPAIATTDDDGTLRRRFRARGGRIVLVRPDGRSALDVRPRASARLLEFFAAIGANDAAGLQAANDESVRGRDGRQVLERNPATTSVRL